MKHLKTFENFNGNGDYITNESLFNSIEDIYSAIDNAMKKAGYKFNTGHEILSAKDVFDEVKFKNSTYLAMDSSITDKDGDLIDMSDAADAMSGEGLPVSVSSMLGDTTILINMKKIDLF